MIRVLIVDDQMVVCEGLRVILDAARSIDVVGIAYDGVEALDKTADLRPDLILMDLKMPGMNGIAATRQVKETYPDISVLVLTTYDKDEWVFDAIRAGADGYLLKDTHRDLIVAAIEGTIAGKTHIDSEIAAKLFSFVRTGKAPETAVVDSLTERERQILQLIALGDSNAIIAEKLFLAKGTIQNYVSTILSKLDLADRTQAAAFAWRYGLVRTGFDQIR